VNRNWNYVIVAVVVVAIVGGCVYGGLMMAGVNIFKNQAEEGAVSAAKAKLTAASVVASMYASQNGSYGGMNAAAMAGIDSSTRWVDGEPAPGQVGISDVTDTSFALTFKETNGTVYRAVKEGNELVIMDAGGKRL